MRRVEYVRRRGRGVPRPGSSAVRNRAITTFTSEIVRLEDVKLSPIARAATGVPEFDRVLGGGVVPGSLVLLGGPPGIGKSTLMLQVAEGLCQSKGQGLYISGEESLEQVKDRAHRLGLRAGQLSLLSETELSRIIEAIDKVRPSFCVIDSIQTTYREDMASAPGSVGQVRECTAEILRLSKSRGITVFVLGHVTKEGDLAGPRVLEHMVDTVLYLSRSASSSFDSCAPTRTALARPMKWASFA